MPETKPKPVELPLAPGWKEYLESFQRACDRSSQEVAALIWTRLYDEGGPPINYRGNEEPDMILRWIHGQLGGRQGTFRTASRDVFLIKLMQFATSTKCETMSQTEESLGELASLIEVCQFRPTGDVSIGDAPSTCLTPQALRWAGNLANLIWISKAEPSAFAAQLADASQSAGSTLLSHILRLIAMFNPGNRADRWWSVLSNDRFQNSAVPALLGLARVSGSGLDARLGLPFVARILSERDRPEDLAFFIRGFERKDYLNHASQDSGDTIRNAIDVGDLRTLFCLVRRDRVDDFRTRFFKTLNALDYIPKRGNLEVWKEASCEDNFPRLVLWDSIDSPRFRNYPAVHAALVPALREARPDLFDKLQALFIQAGSTRIKQIQLGNIHAFRFEMRPVDELYFPINDSLLGPHTLQVATSEPFSCTEADRLIQLLAYRDLSDRDVKTMLKLFLPRLNPHLTETAAPVVAKWTWETTTRSSLLADDRSRGRDKAGKLWLPSTFPKVNLDFPDESYEVRLLTNCREPFSAPPEIKDLSEVSRESGIQNKDIMAALREAILNPYSQSRNATQSQYSIKKINSHQERCEEVVLCRQLAF